MKLSTHYNKAIIIITLLVLLAGGIIYYFAINYIATDQLDKNLTEEAEEVYDYVNTNQKLPKQFDFDEDITVFVKTNNQTQALRFFDTVYSNPREKKEESGRAVSGIIGLKGQYYQFTITVSKEDTEFLIQIIALITLSLVVGLLLILFLTNKYILNGLWQPFYDTLNQLKSVNVLDKMNLNLQKNKVDEFNALNEAVYSMTARVITDYEQLKEFTENASHEMMTPLAVITSKLDTLIQDESLNPAQLEQINDVYLATNKLSRLNQTLLLLVKIENNILDDKETVQLDECIRQKIKLFNELIQAKSIVVNLKLDPINIFANAYLIYLLLNNLLSNAIRHNMDNGTISITLNNNHLIVENSGSEPVLDLETMFNRFQKGKQSEGMGLGLTIVKNICKLYHWDITYEYQNGLHRFIINFNPQ
jgi:signal transduction histidine kinase